MMSEPKTHTGSCHCGKFRYEVTTDLQRVMSCNCSICSKKGSLLTFVSPDRFRLVAGSESDLSVYQFNRKVIHHAFCPTCGVASFGWGTGPDGKKMYAINARCLDDVDLSKVAVDQYDGKSI